MLAASRPSDCSLSPGRGLDSALRRKRANRSGKTRAGDVGGRDAELGSSEATAHLAGTLRDLVSSILAPCRTTLARRRSPARFSAPPTLDSAHVYPVREDGGRLEAGNLGTGHDDHRILVAGWLQLVQLMRLRLISAHLGLGFLAVLGMLSDTGTWTTSRWVCCESCLRSRRVDGLGERRWSVRMVMGAGRGESAAERSCPTADTWEHSSQ